MTSLHHEIGQQSRINNKKKFPNITGIKRSKGHHFHQTDMKKLRERNRLHRIKLFELCGYKPISFKLVSNLEQSYFTISCSQIFCVENPDERSRGIAFAYNPKRQNTFLFLSSWSVFEGFCLGFSLFFFCFP